MLDHVGIRVADRAAAERFYDTVLATLGVDRAVTRDDYTEWGDYAISPVDEYPVTERLHIGFGARSRAEVDEFHRAGVAAGFRSDGEPGPRPEYGEDYYGSFLLDPDGNSVEAVHYAGVQPRGEIDHVWMRVADLAAAARFYATLAPIVGLEHRTTSWGEHFQRDGVGMMLIEDPERPTRGLHLAFGGADNATVDAFHVAALAAGYRDNGAPGERPAYHAGYYGAFVFDPDGNNIEVVCHNR